MAGGRLFPGEHHRARFSVREQGDHFEVCVESLDGTLAVEVRARVVPELPEGSVFASLDAASKFFRQGPLGYSATRQPGRYDGVELHCATWRVEPVLVEHVQSSFFDDPELFPGGAAQFDSALVMRNLPAEWRARQPLVAPEPKAVA